jgi:hypothetical protein
MPILYFELVKGKLFLLSLVGNTTALNRVN